MEATESKSEFQLAQDKMNSNKQLYESNLEEALILMFPNAHVLFNTNVTYITMSHTSYNLHKQLCNQENIFECFNQLNDTNEEKNQSNSCTNEEKNQNNIIELICVAHTSGILFLNHTTLCPLCLLYSRKFKDVTDIDIEHMIFNWLSKKPTQESSYAYKCNFGSVNLRHNRDGSVSISRHNWNILKHYPNCHKKFFITLMKYVCITFCKVCNR